MNAISPEPHQSCGNETAIGVAVNHPTYSWLLGLVNTIPATISVFCQWLNTLFRRATNSQQPL
jgi:hypothetical protein